MVFASQRKGESSMEVRTRVERARMRAQERGVSSNRELRGEALEKFAPLSDQGRMLLRSRLETGSLSMRGAQRTRAVALTLRDLEGTGGPITTDDLEGALLLRGEEQQIGVLT